MQMRSMIETRHIVSAKMRKRSFVSGTKSSRLFRLTNIIGREQ